MLRTGNKIFSYVTTLHTRGVKRTTICCRDYARTETSLACIHGPKNQQHIIYVYIYICVCVCVCKTYHTIYFLNHLYHTIPCQLRVAHYSTHAFSSVQFSSVQYNSLGIIFFLRSLHSKFSTTTAFGLDFIVHCLLSSIITFKVLN